MMFFRKAGPIRKQLNYALKKRMVSSKAVDMAEVLAAYYGPLHNLGDRVVITVLPDMLQIEWPDKGWVLVDSKGYGVWVGL